MVLAERAMGRTGGSGAMFDGIASRYDLLNRLNSLGLDRRWRRIAAEALALGGPAAGKSRVLDVASGTGDLAIAIARRYRGVAVDGLDASTAMTEIGRRKVQRLALADRISLNPGDALELPFPDDSFEAAAIAFGIRNIPDRVRGLREMARVTKPGGRVAVLELGDPPPGLAGAVARFHIRFVVPVVGALLAGAEEYRYLERSIRAFPPAAEFVRTMADAGLDAVWTRPLSFGACNLFVARVPGGEPVGRLDV